MYVDGKRDPRPAYRFSINVIDQNDVGGSVIDLHYGQRKVSVRKASRCREELIFCLLLVTAPPQLLLLCDSRNPCSDRGSTWRFDPLGLACAQNLNHCFLSRWPLGREVEVPDDLLDQRVRLRSDSAVAGLPTAFLWN